MNSLCQKTTKQHYEIVHRYVEHVDTANVWITFAILMLTMAKSKYDHLIHLNVVVHRKDTMSYWLTRMIYENRARANDRDDANVDEKNHRHAKDNEMMMIDDDQAMENENDDDDWNRYY